MEKISANIHFWDEDVLCGFVSMKIYFRGRYFPLHLQRRSSLALQRNWSSTVSFAVHHTLSVYRFLTASSLPVISVLMSLGYKFLIQCSKLNCDRTGERLSQNSVTWFVCFEGCSDLSSTLYQTEQLDLLTVASSTVLCQHTGYIS